MSLLPLARMFIFGGKKKKKDEEDIKEKYERLLEEASKKYGISEEIIDKVRLFAVHNGGQVRILQKVLGIPEKKLFGILDAGYTIPLGHIYSITP